MMLIRYVSYMHGYSFASRGAMNIFVMRSELHFLNLTELK